jgi:5-methyltetrahydropteroyltriglutamate--homocysteine methyltransferase
VKLGVYITGACGTSKKLYKARNEAKRGRGTHQAVLEQIEQDSLSLIETQENKGFSFIVDPQYSFYDLLQPITENVEGVSSGPQENWFNNNVFYIRPQIQGPLKDKVGSFLEKYIHSNRLIQNKSAMAILPSPYTLLKLSDVSGYQNDSEAIRDLAKLLREEAKNLVKKGFTRIQFDEPTIVMKQSLDSVKKEDIELLKEGINEIGKIQGATISLHTYFGDAGPLLSVFEELPVDCIGIDCTETRMSDILKHKFSGKEIALGLINSRTPAMEDPKDIIQKLQKVSDNTDAKQIWLTPNTGLEFIGWTLGHDKLSILEEVKRGFEKNV